MRNAWSLQIKPGSIAYLLGFTSMVSQIVFMRELIIVFYGNELAYALILSSWLFWVGTGSFLTSRLLPRLQEDQRKASVLFLLFSAGICCLLPMMIAIVRFLPRLVGVNITQTMGLISMGLTSFILLCPLTLILGSVFAFLCYYSLKIKRKDAASIGRIYRWEAKGAAVGGLVFSFLLIHLFSTLEIVFLLTVINSGFLIALNHSRRVLLWGIVFLSIVLIALLISGALKTLDDWLRKKQWEPLSVVEVQDSIYGNIVLTKENGQYSLYENGRHVSSTGDELSAEESVHYALLSHPQPREVLLIGGGLTGAVEQILKHPIQRLDYIELDPKVIQMAFNHFPKGMVRPLKDKRVQIKTMDARLFVKQTQKRYDVIIVNLSDPQTALVNRYYTREFFREAARLLEPQGMISLGVSSSENYLNTETRRFLRSIHATLRSVFAQVISIPGDTHYFIASSSADVLRDDPAVFIDRLKQREINTQYVNAAYLPFKMSENRLRQIRAILKGRGVLNTDLHPRTYLEGMLLSSRRLGSSFSSFLDHFRFLNLGLLLLIPLALFVYGFCTRTKWPTLAVSTSILTTGFSEIIFQIIVIFAFQSLYGFAYYRIGLIMASFMVGLVMGGFLAERLIARKSAQIFRYYKFLQAAICFYPLILPSVYLLFHDITVSRNVFLLSGVFAFLPVIAGLIGGCQYPLATFICSHQNEKRSRRRADAAGRLYALDTWGATLGALLTAVILIPILGIIRVCLLAAAINLSVYLLLAVMPYPARSPERL